MNSTKTLVAAAVLGLLAGATACAGARSTPVASPTDPRAAAPSGDKNACGNHPGSSCGAVVTPPEAK